ncbi:hypothetical protein [Rhizobium leguminosarum]|uniref:hypothetical protein n=1 Tax=Rhizobium leguminosarum TaxID=384 RepID=UPI0002F0057B|nr:hypothetical protein [Rhizobium leguminosarum]
MYDKFEVNMSSARDARRRGKSHDRRATDRQRSLFGAIGQKRKKPAAGGGAAGFRKKPNDSWEEECCRSRRRPWEEDGRLHIEGMREEVHRFDRNNHTYFLLSW